MELIAYQRHLNGEYDHFIDIEPMPTPRARGRVMYTRSASGGKGTPFVHMYNPSEYTKYKEFMAMIIKSLHLPELEYSKVYVTFYIQYPKSTLKKNLIEGAPHIKKPDADNFYKGFSDAMEQAGLLKNDGCISESNIRKVYTLKQGHIKFTIH